MQLSEKDLEQIKVKGISQEDIQVQFKNFEQGFPPLELVAPATKTKGITVFEEQEINDFVKDYDEYLEGKKVVKFVPASGAASRMFKNLLAFYNQDLTPEQQHEELQKDTTFNSPHYFFKHIKELAFYPHLGGIMKQKGHNLEGSLSNHDYQTILKYFLTEEGLDYASLPKALLYFHKYADKPRTSIGEHLSEAARYATSTDGIARVHFTLSPEHIVKVQDLLKDILPFYEKKYELKYEISHSIQNPATDTMAVNPDNSPFRNPDGSILFRPGGHGALINNLNDLDADLVFIKNIDNVVPDQLKPATITYKKLIGSYLLDLQESIFEYLEMLSENQLTENIIEEIVQLYEEELMMTFPEGFTDWEAGEQLDFLYEKLNRPIRVCGMVKNEGEPGGGPFWVKQADGTVNLQIVESSQINKEDPRQKEIAQNATHFNPVDLVCSLKNFKGEKFDLTDFIDPETGFISNKSKDGKELKALELPGLWNGAMADWNTVFVEVPLITFNPVKYINDLLRDEHQK